VHARFEFIFAMIFLGTRLAVAASDIGTTLATGSPAAVAASTMTPAAMPASKVARSGPQAVNRADTAPRTVALMTSTVTEVAQPAPSAVPYHGDVQVLHLSKAKRASQSATARC